MKKKITKSYIKKEIKRLTEAKKLAKNIVTKWGLQKSIDSYKKFLEVLKVKL